MPPAPSASSANYPIESHSTPHHTPTPNTMAPLALAVLVVLCFSPVATAFPSYLRHPPTMPASYEALTAAGKEAYLMAQVTANEKSTSWYNTLEQAGIFVENLHTTFTTAQDYPLPTG